MNRLTLDEYQAEARATAIYPGSLLYPALGLAGEIGEFIEAVTEDSDNPEKEAGDIMWYIANVAHDAGLKLSECAGIAGFPRGKIVWSVDELFDSLPILCGKICENVKKAFRDNGGELTDERRNNVRKLLGELIRALSAICYNMLYEQANLEAVASDNLAKLKDRAERGKLKGDGNDR